MEEDIEEIACEEMRNELFAKTLNRVMQTSSMFWSPRITNIADVKILHVILSK
jgi:hypothetical protein